MLSIINKINCCAFIGRKSRPMFLFFSYQFHTFNTYLRMRNNIGLRISYSLPISLNNYRYAKIYYLSFRRKTFPMCLLQQGIQRQRLPHQTYSHPHGREAICLPILWQAFYPTECSNRAYDQTASYIIKINKWKNKTLNALKKKSCFPQFNCVLNLSISCNCPLAQNSLEPHTKIGTSYSTMWTWSRNDHGVVKNLSSIVFL